MRRQQHRIRQPNLKLRAHFEVQRSRFDLWLSGWRRRCCGIVNHWLEKMKRGTHILCSHVYGRKRGVSSLGHSEGFGERFLVVERDAEGYKKAKSLLLSRKVN